MNFDYQGIHGVDVSFWQDSNLTPQQIDFVKMKNWGADFVILKIGQWYYPDPDFGYNWSKSKEAGLPRGGYWFGDARDNGKNQAQKCWSLVKNDPPEGILAIDYENSSWTNWNELYNFLSEIQQLSGFPNDKLAIYTGFPYWTSHSPTTKPQLDWFAQFPLWLAWYTSNVANVRVPAPWTEVLLWQDGTPAIGLEVGVESREIDHNKFNGSAEKFKTYFSSEIAPPPSDKHSVELKIDGSIVYQGEF